MMNKRRQWLLFAATSTLIVQACKGSDNDTAPPGSVTPVGKMSTGRYGHTATLLASGRVLVAGGSDTRKTLSSAEEFDPTREKFHTTGSMSTPRMFHTATLLKSGQVLIAGGTLTYGSSNLSTSSAEVYDPVSGAFKATGSMIASRSFHTATLLPDGRVLILGGTSLETQHGTSARLSDAEIYDPSSGTFALAGRMSTGRSGHTATLLGDGRVLVAGGENDDKILPAAELYNPSTGKFADTGEMIESRRYHTATLLTNGKVLVAGGFGGGVWPSRLNSTELFDPSTGKFSTSGSLTLARDQHTATLLPDGRVLITGSTEPETFDPVGGKFTAGYLSSTKLHEIAAQSELHTATLLKSGMVLIIGGTNELVAYETAELYHP